MDPVGTADKIAQRGRLFPTAMIILPGRIVPGTAGNGGQDRRGPKFLSVHD
jgi:hypothetical protein